MFFGGIAASRSIPRCWRPYAHFSSGSSAKLIATYCNIASSPLSQNRFGTFEMKSKSAVALLACLAWSGTTSAEPLMDAYNAAGESERLVICAPILVKQGGLAELAASNRAPDRAQADQEKARRTALNLMARGGTLQEMAKASNPVALDKYWKMSAIRGQDKSYSILTASCVDLYNGQRTAGKIPAQIEARSIENANRQLAKSSEKSLIVSQCRSKGTPSIDLCVRARAAADEVAATLPMRLNQNLTITTAFADGTRVVATAMLGYDQAFLESTAASKGLSIRDVDAAIMNIAQTSACAPGPLRDFIISGGSVQYKYRFRDGTPYLEPVVASCH